MTPLLSLLLAGLPHGLWPVEQFDDHHRRLVESFDRTVTVVDLRGATTKAEILTRMATTLGFPRWFGHNWDALNDSLAEAVDNQTMSDVTIFVTTGAETNADALTTLLEIVGEVANDAGACFVVAGPGPATLPITS